MRKLTLQWLLLLLITACQKQLTKEPGPIATEQTSGVAATGGANIIDVCHEEGNGTSHTITINANASAAHLAHGDIVPDADGDGFTKVNPCGIGTQDDCDDNNAAIHPGTTEICNNNIDDNCNGQVDENCIPTVTICNQVWMAKNLEVTTYRNGDVIPQVTDPAAWSFLGTGAWCYYNFDPLNGAIYGKLYNWYAVNDPRGLAPPGWHVPTFAEWTALSTCLGGDAVAGGELKSLGTIEAATGLWYAPNTAATNRSGFTGLPGGYCNFDGTSFGIGWFGFWWSSTELAPSAASGRNLAYNNGQIQRVSSGKRPGFSVRCVKD